MATVQELVTKYTFDVDSKPLEEIGEQLKSIGEWALRLGETMAIAAETVFEWTRETAEAGNQAIKTSQQLGISVEKFQELAFAAKMGEVDASSFAVTMGILSKHIVDAGAGGAESAKAFQLVGLSAAQVKNQSPDVVLGMIADRFKSMPDGANKTAAAMLLMGRSGKQMIPVLNGGSEGMAKWAQRAHELGDVMSDEDAAAGEKFTDTLHELMGAFVGLRNMVGVKFMPMLTELMKRFTDWIVANRQWLSLKLENGFKVLIRYVTIAWSVFQNIWQVATGLTEVFGGLGNVLTAAAYGFALLSGGAILVGIGKLVLLMKELEFATIAEDIAAMAIPLAIGAIIVLIALLIEDIYQFFTGGDSVLGTVIDFFKQLGTSLVSWFTTTMASIGTLITDWAKSAADTMMAFFQPIADFFGNIFNGVKAIASGDFSGVKNMAAGLLGFGSAQDSASPISAPVSGGANNNSMNQNVQLQQVINVGDGVDAVAVGKRVENSTGNALSNVLRGAQRSFNPGGG